MDWLRGGARASLLGCLLVVGTWGVAGAQDAAPAGGARYRFQEQYDAAPGAATQYQVAFRERLTTATEAARSAPSAAEQVIQAIYQERPAVVSAEDPRRVLATVRKYSAFRIEPDPGAVPGGVPLFEGLEMYCRQRPGEIPPFEVLVLTPGRSLRDGEFVFASKQVFVPELGRALPAEPLAVGETYALDPAGGAAILGGLVFESTLEGKLKEVKPDTQAGRSVASFEVVGRGQTDIGSAAVRVVIDVSFADAAPDAAGVVDVSGQVVRLRLAEEITAATPPDTGQRMKQYIRRELTLERRVSDPGPALLVPEPAPLATEANSWLTYEDPAGRFHFRHPQDLLRSGRPDPTSTEIELARPRPGGGDRLIVSLREDDQLKVDAVVAGLKEEWRNVSLIPAEVTQEPLEEAEWPGRRVTRISTALRAGAERDGPAVQFDGYVVLTGRTDGLYVEAMSDRVPPDSFRGEVESILRTFELDAAPAAAPETPAPE